MVVLKAIAICKNLQLPTSGTKCNEWRPRRLASKLRQSERSHFTCCVAAVAGIEADMRVADVGLQSVAVTLLDEVMPIP